MDLVMNMKDYREVIQNKRKKLGWSQYKLAKEVGIAQSGNKRNQSRVGEPSPAIPVRTDLRNHMKAEEPSSCRRLLI